jgi:hypothetical protein
MGFIADKSLRDIQANYVFGTVEPWVLGLANLSQL